MGMSKSLWEQHGLSSPSENAEKGDHAKRPLEAKMKRFLRPMIDLFLPSAGIYANNLMGEMNVRPLQSHRLKGRS